MPKNLLDFTYDLTQDTDGEYSGPCPTCGGDDRFIVWPDEGGEERGRYYCRGCRDSDDAIGFLQKHRGYSYPDACKALGLTHKLSEEADTELAQMVEQRKEQTPEPERPERSDAEWAERYKAYMAMTPQQLEIRDWLIQQRAQAQAERNHAAFDRYQQKLDEIHERALLQERAQQEHVQFIDADTDHLGSRTPDTT